MSLPPDAWDRLERTSLTLDLTAAPLDFDRSEVERFYAPLAGRLLAGLQLGRRTVAAVAGPPGSGKSAFAALLAAVANALRAEEVAIVIGLDGWHYPNAYLDTHTIERAGGSIPLRRIKGSPETFDADGAYACLAQLPYQERLSFPVYSRQLHDPLPGGGTVEPWHKLILLEGNYWLLEEEPWLRFRPLFDLRLFLSAGREALVAGLRERHLRGRKTPEETERYIRTVDLPNVDRVLAGSAPADVLVRKADSRRIEAVEWRTG